MYQIDTKLTPANMKKIQSGKSFTVRPGHLSNNNLIPAQILMSKRKYLNRYNKNISMGKGITLKPSFYDDVVRIHDGGKISLKSIGRSFSNIGNYIQNRLQSKIPIGALATYQSTEQIVMNLLLTNLGVNTKVILLILLFL